MKRITSLFFVIALFSIVVNPVFAIDADTLDGKHAEDFVRFYEDNNITSTLIVHTFMTDSYAIGARYLASESGPTVSTGVMGEGSNATDVNYGVQGRAYNSGAESTGTLGFGYGGTSKNQGVYGQGYSTSSAPAYGVYGYGTSNTGTGVVYGVYGMAYGGSTNWAGYFDGNVKITGDLKNNNDHIIWNQDNDGSGSGLDADKLDGKEASEFVQTSGDQTISGTKTGGMYSGIKSALKSQTIIVSGGSSVNIDADQGSIVNITVEDTTAFTINAPTNIASGQEIVLIIRNASGGTMGLITWNSSWKGASTNWGTNPADHYQKIIQFRVYGSTPYPWLSTSVSPSVYF